MSTEADIAHLLRRTTFGPFPGQVEALAPLGYEAVLDAVLQRGDGEVFDEPLLDVPDAGEDDDRNHLQVWWLEQMRRPFGGLHEKLVWFWHNHFTSSGDKCSESALAAQHRRVRRHALGNFRRFAKEMVTDPALMQYLDASGSDGADPNENLARELMELFTLGRGNYTEDDVRAAAKGLAGWWVDWQTAEVHFEPDSAYPGVIEFLGQRGRFSPADLVDIICDQPECARFIAQKLHVFLVGTTPEPERLTELAGVFRDADLAITPLVAAILDHESFRSAKATRPRLGIEWFVAMAAVVDAPASTKEYLWLLESIDQEPFFPPNVAGWRIDERWVSPSQLLARSNLTLDLMADDDRTLTFGFNESNPVPDALRHCSVYEVSESTVAALDGAYWAPFGPDDVDHLLIYLLLTSPEFALA